MESLFNKLWVEKYRPMNLSEISLSDDVKEFFSKMDEKIPNLLLVSEAGFGKTTLAKIIVNDILKCQYLYINASDENGVETIRSKVISFAKTRSFDGGVKVVILDEADALSNEAQRILRGVMEEYSETCRFILTANYGYNIIEPIQSRCKAFEVKPKIEECLKRCLFILKAEQITSTSEQQNLLVTHIKEKYPDMRKIITDLQIFSVTGELQIATNKTGYETFVNDLAEHVFVKKTDSIKIRKIIIENDSIFEKNYQKLMKSLFSILCDATMEANSKNIRLTEIAEFIYRDNFVADHEINFFHLLININNIK